MKTKRGFENVSRNLIVTVLVILITFCFIQSPLRGDLTDGLRWMDNVYTHGIITGYRLNHNIYPPFASVILLGVAVAAHMFGISYFIAFKLFYIFFLFIISMVFLIWTRNFLLTVALHISLLYGCMILNYGDIIIMPSFILAMWALQKKRLLLFSLLYSISCLIKWQPLIIAPVLLVYLLNINAISDWNRIPFKKLSLTCCVPVVIIFGSVLLTFKLDLLYAFIGALKNHPVFSNALNFPWIFTYFLHVFAPHRFGGLTSGMTSFILKQDLLVTFLPKLLFFLYYTINLVVFFKQDKTFEKCVNFSFIGYLAYFMFNTGVCENHLFLNIILSFILVHLNKKHMYILIIMVLIHNINPFIYYGIGKGLDFNLVVGIDMTVLLSLFNLVFFIFVAHQCYAPNGRSIRPSQEAII